MNAKEELMQAVSHVGKIPEYGNIVHHPWNNKETITRLSFADLESYNSFLSSLAAIDYDAGYGSQELFGYIVFTDGTWLDRQEYDGSEWWRYNAKPERSTKVVSSWEPDA